MNDRVLLVSPERLGHGRPAGVGIRMIELARALTTAQLEVTVLSPDGAEPEGTRGRATSPAAILEESRRAGVAIVQGHIANDFFAHAERIPTVVDMYDPYLVENLSYASSDHGIWKHDWETTVQSLRRGDFFLCASSLQRAYYIGWLAALGRINPESFDSDPTLDSILRVVPFGVPPARPIPDKSLESPAILFGGVYDWYDPIVAIESAARASDSMPGLTLTFVSHPNADETPQSKLSAAKKYVEKRRLTSTIRFRDWFPYEERAAVYDRHVAALLTFPRTLETELSFRTRVLDYLWGGLPVLSSPAAGTDEILDRYEAGAVVESDGPDEVARDLVKLLSDPSRYRSLVEGTQRFVRDYQWGDLAAPLVAFCRNPKVDPYSERFVSLEAGATVDPPSLFDRAIRKAKRKFSEIRSSARNTP